jgi:hypothetical protein
MEFSCFDDYWLPFTRSEGPPGQFVASLSDTARSALQEHVRWPTSSAYLMGRARSRAWHGLGLSWDRSSVTAPPRENDDGGRPYVARNASLNRRTLRNPAAKAISDSPIVV